MNMDKFAVQNSFQNVCVCVSDVVCVRLYYFHHRMKVLLVNLVYGMKKAVLMLGRKN